MQDLIAKLTAKLDLSPTDIEFAVDALISPQIGEGTKALFLKTLREKKETAEELAGFVNALLQHAIDPQISSESIPGPMIDVCGTGGDRMELFNISTTCMFVLAAGGAVVLKHGNRGITSKCGGADVLETLGIKIDLTPAALRESVKRTGMGFIFAPHYHPAFKLIAPVRKALAAQGIATIFNLLGPLLNPARPPYQLVGIFSQELLPLYAKALALLDRQHAWAVHGAGMDELSTLGQSEVHEVKPGGSTSFIIDPSQFGFKAPQLSELQGGDSQQNAAILTAILDGSETGPKRDVVVLNSAAAFVVANLAPDMETGVAMAQEQLNSGLALAKLREMQAL